MNRGDTKDTGQAGLNETDFWVSPVHHWEKQGAAHTVSLDFKWHRAASEQKFKWDRI